MRWTLQSWQTSRKGSEATRGHREWLNEEWRRECRRAIWKEFCLAQSTCGGETEPPRRTWDRVPHRNLQVSATDAARHQNQETNKSGFNPAGVEGLLDVNERGESTRLKAMAPAPAEARSGKGPVVEGCGAMRAETRCSKTLKAQEAKWDDRKWGSPLPS